MNVQQSFKSSAAGEGTNNSGTLYLVGTPIGNLEDMTFRAVRTLKEVDLIAAEDTRQTRKLLTHYEISTRLVSYHEHNKEASGNELLRLLEEGQSIALVSDAGLPAISDPGADLVADAVKRSIAVVPIPGANAALSALIVSGLPTDRFLFVGFPPRDRKPLTAWLDRLYKENATIICYESPHRVAKTLAAMLEQWGDRPIAMVRELTKRHEEVARGLNQNVRIGSKSIRRLVNIVSLFRELVQRKRRCFRIKTSHGGQSWSLKNMSIDMSWRQETAKRRLNALH